MFYLFFLIFWIHEIKSESFDMVFLSLGILDQIFLDILWYSLKMEEESIGWDLPLQRMAIKRQGDIRQTAQFRRIRYKKRGSRWSEYRQLQLDCDRWTSVLSATCDPGGEGGVALERISLQIGVVDMIWPVKNYPSKNSFISESENNKWFSVK